MVAQVAITRVDDKATWETLMFRPANKRFFKSLLYNDLKGMEYGAFRGMEM
jgi:hypothetical protein